MQTTSAGKPRPVGANRNNTVRYENNDLLNYIADEYGPDAAATIQENFGGESFYIPKKRAQDDIQNHILANPQKSARQLARETGLTVRQIQRRLNWRVSKSQQQLFD